MATYIDASVLRIPCSVDTLKYTKLMVKTYQRIIIEHIGHSRVHQLPIFRMNYGTIEAMKNGIAFIRKYNMKDMLTRTNKIKKYATTVY